ncbi:hypothetical protein [Burkholderia stagnalis]|uniref:hypothetical protein n=1 Tax=Burkholderia stagnalis TaxID=1503054 RepID=UPI0012DAE9CD|nr:hypothetical protein [Burkholderia stagnalis]
MFVDQVSDQFNGRDALRFWWTYEFVERWKNRQTWMVSRKRMTAPEDLRIEKGAALQQQTLRIEGVRATSRLDAQSLTRLAPV